MRSTEPSGGSPLVSEPQNHLPRMIVRDHRLEVPLVHGAPDGRSLTVFAREVVATERCGDDLPWLVFFQGGPGYAAPRPEARTGWIGRALRDHRVLLLDQRGTGLSAPVTAQTLAGIGGSAAQAEYLSHFRADAIVADAEAFRHHLNGGRPWRVLGQSFGGFCVLTYLSFAPEALDGAIVTGGIPSLTEPAESVYRATYPRVRERNAQLFARYPRARGLVDRIARTLHEQDVRLPNGQRLTVRQFQLLGLGLGMAGGAERLMDLLDRAFVVLDGRETLSETFLHGVYVASDFHWAPIFAVLHEAIYGQGKATGWAAERVRREHAEFDWEPGTPFLFTGEMIYPWMFDEYLALAPLQGAAERLAAKADWPALYDPARLRANRVPLAVALYHDDMFVDLGIALATLREVGNAEVWITNEYEHDGLRRDGERVLDRLLGMLPAHT